MPWTSLQERDGASFSTETLVFASRKTFFLFYMSLENKILNVNTVVSYRMWLLTAVYTCQTSCHHQDLLHLLSCWDH